MRLEDLRQHCLGIVKGLSGGSWELELAFLSDVPPEQVIPQVRWLDSGVTCCLGGGNGRFGSEGSVVLALMKWYDFV